MKSLAMSSEEIQSEAENRSKRSERTFVRDGVPSSRKVELCRPCFLGDLSGNRSTIRKPPSHHRKSDDSARSGRVSSLLACAETPSLRLTPSSSNLRGSHTRRSSTSLARCSLLIRR